MFHRVLYTTFGGKEENLDYFENSRVEYRIEERKIGDDSAKEDRR
jgi:hypothetical protein